MREKLNENPIAQLALIAVLLIAGAIIFLKPGGGAKSEEPASAEGGLVVPESLESLESMEAGATASAAGEIPTAVPAPPPPAPITAAYEAGKVVVLLLVHDGGIDDALTAAATAGAADQPGTALFVVPAAKVFRYAAITVGLDVNQVPALVVMRPRGLSHGVPQATVQYGFQTPESVAQAVRDASYKGPEATYHPG